MSQQSLAHSGGQQLPETREEALTRQFYEWEGRGRGWLVAPSAVELEPPFRPFYRTAPSIHAIADDGRKSTFLSRLADSFRGSGNSVNQALARQQSIVDEIDEPIPDYCQYGDQDFTELKVILPRDLKVTKAVAEQLLLSLSYCRAPVSFELVGTTDAISVQFAAVESDAAQVKQQLKAHLPAAVVLEQNGYLLAAWERAQGGAVIVDFGLSREFVLPLEVVSSFEIDPLVAAAGALSNLQPDETGVLQVLFAAARQPWSGEMMDSIRNFDGTAFFANAPEMLPLAKQKVGRPLFAAVIRVAARSYTSHRAWQIVRNIGGAFTSLSNPAGNELIPLSNDGYDDGDHEGCLLLRQSHRLGMILNSEELVSLVHPPSAVVQNEKLGRDALKTKPAPAMTLNHSLVLGTNEHQGRVREVGLSLEQRTRHVHLIGTSGSGKSTLMLNLIRQDMQNGEGMAIFDPHGDLVDDVLAHVPDYRLSDVILFDPSDSDYPIGFNPLQANSEAEKTLLASDLVATFRRFSTSWGDVMDAVLANAILAIIESSKGGTLFDLKRLLVEKEFRYEFLKTVNDESVRYFWQHEYETLAGRSQSSILVRLDTFLRQKLIRNVVCQKQSRLNFREIMDKRKILLVRLAQGAIGEENSYLLGTLLVSKLHQIALARQDTEKEKRAFFGIYLDEFHNFITPSMEALLSGVRKYNVGLHLAHQEFRQLQSRNAEVAHSVLTNCYTRICFRLGDADAEKFASGFGFFDAAHLQNLGVGEAIARVERSEYDFNLQTEPAPIVSPEVAENRKAEVRRHSREQYAALKAEVENQFSGFRQNEAANQTAEAETTGTKKTARETASPKTGMPDVAAKTKTATPAPHNESPRSSAKQSGSSPSLPRDVSAERAAPPVSEKDNQANGGEIKSGRASTTSAPPPFSAAPDQGRGGQQHRYLQSLFKRLAESRGYLVTLEQPVLGGAGQVDISLEQNGDKSIAVEISVTSTIDYEVQNVQKCLASGYETVVLVVSDKRKLSAFHQAISEAVPQERHDHIKVMLPDDFLSFLESKTAAGSFEDKNLVKGRRVNLKLKSVGENTQGTRREAITKVMWKAFKRLKTKDD